MDEPFRIFYEEFHERAADIVEQEVVVEDDLTEIAHETYETTANRLLNLLDMPEDEALTVTKSFGPAMKQWIAEGHSDWDRLLELLEAAQMEWENTREISTR